MAASTPLKKKAVVRVAFNRVLDDGLNYPGWNLLFAPGLQAAKLPKDWLLVHERSGLLIGGSYRTLTQVLEFARKLADVTDWTQSVEEVRTIPNRHAVEALLMERMTEIVALRMEERAETEQLAA